MSGRRMSRVSRRTVLAGGMAGAGALALGRPAWEAAASKSRPNIVVFLTDNHNAESVRVMQNVQRELVDRGTTFANSFCTTPWCAPSRATLLTGQYAHNHGVEGVSEDNYAQLDHTNTLPVWLQREGYHTAHLGKYVNHYEEVGQADPSAVPPGWSDWNASVNTYNYLNTTLNENGTLVNYQGQYQTDVYAEKGADIVRRAAATGKPFFTWICFTATHAEQGAGAVREPDDPGTSGPGVTPTVADRHRDAFVSEPLPNDPSFNEADLSDKPRFMQDVPLLPPQRQANVRERYQQQLEALLSVDEAVGNILGALDETGQADNTLVVFTCDNGFLNGEHRLAAWMSQFYEPSVRVPLIMRGPGIPAGVTRDQLVANIDLAPTFVQAAQATAGLDMDGRPLQPLARDSRVAQGRPILLEVERVGHSNTSIHPRGAAVRTSQHMYAEYDYADGGRDVELYDLATDPHQLASRHDDPGYAGRRAELAGLLQDLRSA